MRLTTVTTGQRLNMKVLPSNPLLSSSSKADMKAAMSRSQGLVHRDVKHVFANSNKMVVFRFQSDRRMLSKHDATKPARHFGKDQVDQGGQRRRNVGELVRGLKFNLLTGAHRLSPVRVPLREFDGGGEAGGGIFGPI